MSAHLPWGYGSTPAPAPAHPSHRHTAPTPPTSAPGEAAPAATRKPLSAGPSSGPHFICKRGAELFLWVLAMSDKTPGCGEGKPFPVQSKDESDPWSRSQQPAHQRPWERRPHRRKLWSREGGLARKSYLRLHFALSCRPATGGTGAVTGALSVEARERRCGGGPEEGEAPMH